MKTKYLCPLVGLLFVGCVTRTTTVTAPPHGPSVAEVQAMVQAHVSDSVIVNQIQLSSTRYTMTADQIIALKNAGASDAVLDAMITSVNKAPAQTTIVEQSPAVYPAVYVDPWPFWGWWGGPYYYGYYGHGYYRGGYRHWR